MRDKSGSAFPIPADTPDRRMPVEKDGMSLRDYIAVAAMQGWLASFGPEADHPAARSKYSINVANASYAMADAMLAAREGAT